MGADSPAFDGLSFVEDIAVDFAPVPRLPDASATARLNAQNAQTLIADASLEESHRVHDPGTDDAAFAADLQRLEFKVNVLLQLVVRLTARSETLPPPQPVRVYAGGMEWHSSPGDPAPGSVVRARLFINPAFPLPLELIGVVAMPRRDGDSAWSRLAWHGLSPAVIDLLGRLIFRHHRRQVAGSRTASTGI